jgi:hypothetical protein
VRDYAGACDLPTAAPRAAWQLCAPYGVPCRGVGRQVGSQGKQCMQKTKEGQRPTATPNPVCQREPPRAPSARPVAWPGLVWPVPPASHALSHWAAAAAATLTAAAAYSVAYIQRGTTTHHPPPPARPPAHGSVQLWVPVTIPDSPCTDIKPPQIKEASLLRRSRLDPGLRLVVSSLAFGFHCYAALSVREAPLSRASVPHSPHQASCSFATARPRGRSQPRQQLLTRHCSQFFLPLALHSFASKRPPQTDRPPNPQRKASACLLNADLSSPPIRPNWRNPSHVRRRPRPRPRPRARPSPSTTPSRGACLHLNKHVFPRRRPPPIRPSAARPVPRRRPAAR